MPHMSQGKKYAIIAAALFVCVAAGAATTRIWQKAPEPVQADSAVVVETPSLKADTSLITRLIPSSEIRSVEKLDMGMGTWMWEVDMLADKANPKTSGFVYLSADGTKILNGPLMDKRSRIMSLPEGSAAAASASHDSANDPEPADEGSSSPQQSAAIQQSESPGAEAIAKKVKHAAEQREMFLSGIEKLPYFSTTKGKNPVYVLFDPLCSACQKLYKQHKAIAQAYDAEFRWIPIFNNEQSYPLSALLRKTYDKDPVLGSEMLDQMLSKTWNAEDHFTDIAGLTEGDYGLVKPAAAVYLAITREMPGIGTPFVMFRNANEHAEAFGGVPYSTDWALLKTAN
ncbi:DsbA family protein [Pseudomonas sp. UMAB-40]|uniref:DsbA family protein n=1 Tax=Pseudomonas sp. UMAB-40 TaxID=1365407 RepID=UPI001C5865B3|nr:DsbA family protein [Pseudomonas sp. UMAB-40]